MNEKRIEPIDRAIRLGEKYGIHVNICLHRAPGLCILDLIDRCLRFCRSVLRRKQRANSWVTQERQGKGVR
jgi:hypothetical protein